MLWLKPLESLENAVLKILKRRISIIDKEAAIKEAKEEIGKEKSFEGYRRWGFEIGDVIADWPADKASINSSRTCIRITDKDQAWLDEADKEAQVDAASSLQIHRYLRKNWKIKP